MQMTLLDMTQNILSALNSDDVNSISDTTESLQVANIIKTTYFNLIARADLTEHNQLSQLISSGSALLPTLMYAPDNMSKLKWIKYFDSNITDGTISSQFGAYSHGVNTDLVPSGWKTTSVTSNTIGVGTKTFTVGAGLNIAVNNAALVTSGVNTMSGTVTSYSGTTLVLNITAISGSGTFTSWVIAEAISQSAPGYQYVTILPIEQFLQEINSFNPTESNVGQFTFTEGGNNFTFYFKDDQQPRYCTVIANYYVIFDTYDNTQDSTLQSSKTMCMAQIVPTFTMTDTFIPNLDLQQFPLLLNEAKSLAFFELKNSVHPKAEQEAKRQWSKVQKGKSIVDRPTPFNALPNFGRRPGTGGYAVYQRPTSY